MTGGTISGNTATNGSGGGVSVYGTGTFKKTAGTIYGNVGTPLANTATSGNGHAVYVNTDTKKRDSTAGTEDNLDSTKTGAAGDWE
jgi:hypothetical protein